MRKKMSIVLSILLFLFVLSNVLILAVEEEWSCSDSDCNGGCTLQGNYGEDPCEGEDPCCGYCWWLGFWGIQWLECCHTQCPPKI